MVLRVACLAETTDRASSIGGAGKKKANKENTISKAVFDAGHIY